VSKNNAGSITLLLVEDEQLALDLLTTILARKFPEIALYGAHNGIDALELFKIHRHDIVISDLNMPGMDGEQLAINIRDIKPETKFIVLTGDCENMLQHKSAGNKLVFDQLIMKPVVFQELFAAIEKALEDVKGL
jgi:YesN/AraC family two-component response regulator